METEKPTREKITKRFFETKDYKSGEDVISDAVILLSIADKISDNDPYLYEAMSRRITEQATRHLDKLNLSTDEYFTNNR